MHAAKSKCMRLAVASSQGDSHQISTPILLKKQMVCPDLRDWPSPFSLIGFTRLRAFIRKSHKSLVLDQRFWISKDYSTYSSSSTSPASEMKSRKGWDTNLKAAKARTRPKEVDDTGREINK